MWAGEVTNDAFAPLRAPRLTLARAQRERDRARGRAVASARAAAGAQATGPGRWSLTGALFARATAEPAPARRRTLAELLLERYGIVTREQVLAEGIAGGFSTLYDALSDLETLGVCRRGYFVEGLGGAQFALPGAVERLRSQRDRPRPTTTGAAARARRYRPGAALRRGAQWPLSSAETATPARRRAARSASRAPTSCSSAPSPSLYVERGGRGLATLVDARRRADRPALEALAAFVTAGRASASSRSSASTASPSSAHRSSRCWSSSASARARAS